MQLKAFKTICVAFWKRTFRSARSSESNLAEIAKLPVPTQRKVHELRNQVSVLNRDVAKSDTYLMMTFNSSLSEGSYEKVIDELNGLYLNVQRRCKTTAEKIESILSDL
jgi:hypothetical protein